MPIMANSPVWVLQGSIIDDIRKPNYVTKGKNWPNYHWPMVNKYDSNQSLEISLPLTVFLSFETITCKNDYPLFAYAIVIVVALMLSPFCQKSINLPMISRVVP